MNKVMANPPIYYNTKLCEIENADIRRLFAGLRFDGGWREYEHDNLSVFSFLYLYFVQTRAGKIKLAHVTPHAFLDDKVSALAGSEIYVLCREVAQGVGEHFEGHENKKVLIFLKGMMKKLKGPKR